MYRPYRSALATLIALFLSQSAAADEAFYFVPLNNVHIVDGSLSDKPADPATPGQRKEAMEPYVALDGEGEAYVDRTSWPGNLAVRLPRPGDVSGRLFLPKGDYGRMAALRFKLTSKQAGATARKGFYWSKEAYYLRQAGRGVPGSAWFRHLARLAREALPASEQANRAVSPFAVSRLDDQFTLFSGNRAVSENLQLDRALPAQRDGPIGEALVDVATLPGISVAAIDWRPLIDGLHPTADPLAALVPADQHAVFFGSFAAMTAAADEIKSNGTLIARLLDPRAEDEQVQARYERQLGLSLSTLSRLLGPLLVESIAVTGSDPYFFAGTDVAVLFETPQTQPLAAILIGKIAAETSAVKGVEAVQGVAGGVRYSGFRSPDRRVSSYVAAFDRAVAVTNSLAQLKRLIAVQAGDNASLSSLDEYTFFRDRYPRGDARETVFAFLSDATIRRWCGPRWRIADARRTLALARMSEFRAEQVDALARGAAPPAVRAADALLGELRFTAAGIGSSVYGSLEFMTPIVELPLDKVTRAEADAYGRWRDDFQRNWSRTFDPVGLRIDIQDNRLSADLTVMPLIASSRYASMLNQARDARIEPGDGDPHEVLFHFASAIDLATLWFDGPPAPAVGSLFADHDDFWQELAGLDDSKDVQTLICRHLDRLPLGLHIQLCEAIEENDPFEKLMSIIRSYLTQKEDLTYRDQAYMKLSLPGAGPHMVFNIEFKPLYCAIAADRLLLTFHEGLLKRYLDRQAERHEAERRDEVPPAAAQRWLGAHGGLRFDRQAIEVLGKLWGDDYRSRSQSGSWGNLPILNEWRRHYPDRDPVELHEQLWHVRLVCTGGGRYDWNEEWQTMESTAFGHPGQPRPGPAALGLLQTLRGGNLGFTFENQGLRAKAVLEREKP
ncbi:MAG TPA: hypothetical protein VND64_07765 [Pirellulales bacterium]|nr:hypothetical protein [Pirellulales bacterium]